ncbi:MAG: hypothetical protein ACK53Y_06665, partial [bacterium]
DIAYIKILKEGKFVKLWVLQKARQLLLKIKKVVDVEPVVFLSFEISLFYFVKYKVLCGARFGWLA